MNKKQLSERDICTKYITPALEKAGWDVTTHNEKGSVLVAMYGANIGEVGILEIEASTNQAKLLNALMAKV